MRVVLLALLALCLIGCPGSLRLYGGTVVPDGDDDDDAAPDDDDIAPDDDDVVPDDDDVVPDDDDVVPDDDDVADDDDFVPPDCVNGPPGVAADAGALASALDIEEAELVSVVGAEDEEMMAVRTGLGGICPVVGTRMALLSTGLVTNIETIQDFDYPGGGPDGSAGDLAELTLLLDAPAAANSLEFYFLFLSREYPEWVGSEYNDGFEATVDGSAYSGPVALDPSGEIITVDTGFMIPPPTPAWLQGTGFDEDGSTGWVRATAPITGGETVTLRFWVYDSADGVYDSAVLLDGVQFSEDTVVAPSSEQVWP